MGFFDDHPYTAISVAIDDLASEKYSEDSVEGIFELLETIRISNTGIVEASRALRKKLKYGSPYVQLRSLNILDTLIENGGKKFQNSFADEKLVERLRILATDSSVDRAVRKKTISLLYKWSSTYVSQPGFSGIIRITQYIKKSPAVNNRKIDPYSANSKSSQKTKSNDPFEDLNSQLHSKSRDNNDYSEISEDEEYNDDDDDHFKNHSRKKNSLKSRARSFSEGSHSNSKKFNYKGSSSNRDNDQDFDTLNSDSDSYLNEDEDEQNKAIRQRRERKMRLAKIREQEEASRIKKQKQIEFAKAQALKKKELEKKKKKKSVSNATSSTRRTVPINIETEKTKVRACIADASSAATNLSNRLKLINVDLEMPMDNKEVVAQFDRCRKLRRQILKYIQMFETEEFIGPLIHTNDELVEALKSYDKMNYPSENDLDSDVNDIEGSSAVENKMKKLNIGGSSSSKDKSKLTRSRYNYSDPSTSSSNEDDDDSDPYDSEADVMPGSSRAQSNASVAPLTRQRSYSEGSIASLGIDLSNKRAPPPPPSAFQKSQPSRPPPPPSKKNSLRGKAIGSTQASTGLDPFGDTFSVV